MTERQARTELTEKTKFYLDKAHELFPLSLSIPEIQINFDLKGRTAGQAFTTSGKIRYNLTALTVEGGWDHLLNQTVPHEVAHMVQYNCSRFPTSRQVNTPHGAYWQSVMRKFGVRPDRCHDLPLPAARKRKTYLAKCPCKQHEISSVIANKMLKGHKYRCNRCKIYISLV